MFKKAFFSTGIAMLLFAGQAHAIKTYAMFDIGKTRIYSTDVCNTSSIPAILLLGVNEPVADGEEQDATVPSKRYMVSPNVVGSDDAPLMPGDCQRVTIRSSEKGESSGRGYYLGIEYLTPENVARPGVLISTWLYFQAGADVTDRSKLKGEFSDGQLKIKNVGKRAIRIAQVWDGDRGVPIKNRLHINAGSTGALKLSTPEVAALLRRLGESNAIFVDDIGNNKIHVDLSPG